MRMMCRNLIFLELYLADPTEDIDQCDRIVFIIFKIWSFAAMKKLPDSNFYQSKFFQ